MSIDEQHQALIERVAQRQREVDKARQKMEEAGRNKISAEQELKFAWEALRLYQNDLVKARLEELEQ